MSLLQACQNVNVTRKYLLVCTRRCYPANISKGKGLLSAPFSIDCYCSKLFRQKMDGKHCISAQALHQALHIPRR